MAIVTYLLGAFVATGGGMVVNSYASVTADAASGATHLTVDSTLGFAAGRLVLVVRVGGLTSAPPSGSQAPLSLDATDVGLFGLARLKGVAPGSLELATPLDVAVTAGRTQLVSVPEYTDVTLPVGASIVAKTWDGAVGGIVAFLATGAIHNAGVIDASGAGFRGGAYQQDTVNTGACTSADLAPPRAGQKGEGIATDSYGGGFGGFGNVGNGAGGGNCDRGGGGGGGHGANGGKGGLSNPAIDTGGRGGAKLTYDAARRITFGGGGGAGHATLTTGFGTSGGAGGGAVFVRAGSLDGAGFIRANGKTADRASGNSAGDAAAGGGGAGGLLHLRFAGAASCGGLEARGGDGGGSDGVNNGMGGPGGGGAGGRMLLQAGDFAACGGSAVGGLAGLAAHAVNGTYGGAEPSSTSTLAGFIDVLAGPFAP